jgi:outer membrane receptor protein involved in Fe transport
MSGPAPLSARFTVSEKVSEIMKPTLTLNSILLLTSCLVWPSLAHAQDTTPDDPPSAEAPVDESEEIVVLGRFIPEPMRQTSEVATFLSADDLERTGDSNAAEALTRLSGLSVVSDRFVFVRGLGDRYSSALLNGSPLPSPEPLRRTVPLDLFPSNILDGAIVQKTFSPNYPGEFGGGVIDLRTVRLPNSPFFTVQLGTGINSETTFRQGLYYYGSDTDWTGFDDGTRDIPRPLQDALGRRSTLGAAGFTDRQLEAIGESLVNSPLSVIQVGDISPDFDAEVSAGTSIDYGRYNIGLVGVAGYDSGWSTQRATRQIGTDTIPLGRDQQSLTTAWEVTSNFLGSASIGWDDHEIALIGLYVRSTRKEAQITSGFDFNAPSNANGESLAASEATAWYERQLASLQLSGEHAFGDLEIDWRVAAARSTRDAPYERSVDFLIDATGTQFYGRSNSNSVRFSELQDDVASGGVDLRYTFPLSEQRDVELLAGIAYGNTVRTFDRSTFLFGGGSNLPADVARARVDFLFGPDNIDPNRFVLLELTGPDDAYKGRLRVSSAYLGADVEVLPLVRVAVGGRFEDSTQTVRTSNRFGAPTTGSVLIDEQYFLPAVTLTWNFYEDMQLRFGYSQTIARPQFRELAVSPYIDPDSDRTYRGNPFLLDSELTNYDIRYEYYLGRNQFMTAGLFYKDILNPIEEVQSETSTLNFLTTFINAPQAILYGAELEYRTRFEIPSDNAFIADKTWLFSVNYTYTSAEIEAGAGDFVFDPLRIGERSPASNFALDGQPLQGTPENIVNLQFGYEGPNSQATLLVGWVSERVLQRGLGGLSDVVDDSGVNVDLTYRQDFELGGTGFTLGLSGRNLLDERYVESLETGAGTLDFNSYDRGRSFSVSVTARF